MKRTIIAAAFAAAGLGAAAQASNYLIFLNPGHGGHDSDDRNVVIAPYQQGDPNGYWESNSNLTKALWLRQMLEAKGYRVKMSRTTNTSADDLKLSTISTMANQAGADLFFSIHSNATGTTNRANFPLMLYRGWDNEADNPADREVALILNRHLLENGATYWTDARTNVRGDWSFYNWGYKVGLGVLSGLSVTGMLSEGSFHDYIPETYRLMSDDYCRLEAWHFRRAVDEYFGQPGETVGQIAGLVKDSRLPRSGDYIMHGDDKTATVQSATVELYDASGTLVGTTVTDPVHINGLYAFRDVTPGSYHLKVTASTHYSAEADIVVKADSISYMTLRMDRIRDTAPEVTAYSPVYTQGDEPLLCNTPVSLTFNWDMDTKSVEQAFSITPAVEGTFAWSNLNYTMTFTPSKPMDINTLYTVRLAAGCRHAGGTPMEQPFEFGFLTTNRNFMEITQMWPRADVSVHYTDAAVELRLDKFPDGSALTSQITCTDSKGQAVAFNKTGKKVSSTRSRYGFARLPFSGELTPGETYTLRIDGSLADRDGITIKAPVSVTFTACNAATEMSGATAAINYTDASAFTAAAGTALLKQSSAVNTKAKFEGAAWPSFTYEFEGTSGGEAVWNVDVPAEFEASVKYGSTLGMMVNGDLSGNILRLRLCDSQGQKFEIDLGKLDFLGWHVLSSPVSQGDGNITVESIAVVQDGDRPDNVDGTFGIAALLFYDNGGISDPAVDPAGVSVTTHPESDYLVANAPCTILRVELTTAAGAAAASAAGNVVNVSTLTPGVYICRIVTAAGVTTRKVTVY